jgi:hypothetical protein
MSVLTPACGPTAPVVAGKDARAAVGQQTVAPGKGTLHSFTLHNTSGVASTQTIARLGLAFLKGDVPAGKRIAVRQRGGPQIAFAAAAATNTWADGSLRSTADGGLVMFDGVPLPAGGSRSYEVFVRNGDIATSGFDPFAWLAAHGNDLTVAVTARTGSATGPRPDLLFSLKTAIATTTRREILCDTRRFVRIKAWQKVPQEEHLICEYHLDFWLDGTGQPWGLEFAPVLTQHWWVADPFGVTQTKERQTYDATVKYGTTVLDTRTRLDHAYYCRWASLRPQDDAQHARKHWIGLGLSQMPTVRVQYDDESLKRMMKAGYVPPFRLGVNYDPDKFPTSYVPLATNGHRAGINGTGAYVGRGMWGDPDAKLLSRQASATAATAEGAWRSSRVMAQAGVSAYHHIRDHRSATGVNGGTDTTNRLIPGVLRKITTTYTGLAGPCVYSKGTRESTTGLAVLPPQSTAVGGTGSFSSYDTAHSVNYSGPTAFLEGETYLGEAALSCFLIATVSVNWNALGCDRGLLYYDAVARRTAQSIPTAAGNYYGTNPDVTTQDRAMAWSLNLLNATWCLAADDRTETPWLKNMILNLDNLLSDSYGYYPAEHRDKGIAFFRLQYQGLISPWMNNWQGMAAYQLARTCDFLPDNARNMNGIEETALLAARFVIKQFANSPYSIGHYHHMWGTDAAGLQPVPDDEWPGEYLVTFTGSIGTATPPVGMSWTKGDKLRIMPFNANFAAQAIPSGLAQGTLYYLVNVSGNTFQLSRADGGSPIVIADQSNVSCYITSQQEASVTPIGPIGIYYWPPDDSYFTIAYALFEQSIGEQHPDATQQVNQRGRAFFAPKVSDIKAFATWNYDGQNLI